MCIWLRFRSISVSLAMCQWHEGHRPRPDVTPALQVLSGGAVKHLLHQMDGHISSGDNLLPLSTRAWLSKVPTLENLATAAASNL